MGRGGRHRPAAIAGLYVPRDQEVEEVEAVGQHAVEDEDAAEEDGSEDSGAE